MAKSAGTVDLESVVAPWPIASCLSRYLGGGDLVSLARCSAGLRAALHGFEKPAPPVSTEAGNIRLSLNIGLHDTLYWQRLKEEAQFVCSSPTHTRGDKCHACRLCSQLICEACFIRSSLQRGKENTFNNRIRFLCLQCWSNGNVTKSRRFPLSSSRRHKDWYSGVVSGDDHCTCTFKDDGWLCLNCKDQQNQEANGAEVKICHGEGCQEPVGPFYDKRRICLWCQKTLPSAYAGLGRHVWTQQMIDARQRSMAAYSADLEEYNRARVSNLFMTRRELRGDAAVQDDPDADKPRFVRHLDTLNYFNYMSTEDAPSGQEVYDSKRGYWRYNKNFMLDMRRRCRRVPAPTGELSHILHSSYEYARTNAEKLKEYNFYDSLDAIWHTVWNDFSAAQKKKFAIIKGEALPNVVSCNLWRAGNAASQDRVNEWHSLKARILDTLFTQRLDMFQARVHLWHNYAFWAERAEFEVVLTAWSHEYEAIEQQPILASHDDERQLIWQSCPQIQITDLDEEDLDDNQSEAENASEEYKILSLLQEEFTKADMRMRNLRPLTAPVWARTEESSCGSDDDWSDHDEKATHSHNTK